MAGDWIKIEHTTPDKPEVYALAQELQIDPDAVLGKLIRFWSWIDQQAIDGNAITVTSGVIDRITHHPGFAQALQKIGWIIQDTNQLTIPNFDRHNGKTAKSRAISNRRVAKHRKSNARTVTDETPAPLPKPLPEKRREEEVIEKENAGGDSAPDLALPRLAEQIVTAYPRGEKIAAALTLVLRQLQTREIDPHAALAGTQAAAAFIRTIPSGALNKWLPSAETFFRDKRWQDDPTTLHRPPETTGGPNGKPKLTPAQLAAALGQRQPLTPPPPQNPLPPIATTHLTNP
jgi:hypothetical protein